MKLLRKVLVSNMSVAPGCCYGTEWVGVWQISKMSLRKIGEWTLIILFPLYRASRLECELSSMCFVLSALTVSRFYTLFLISYLCYIFMWITFKIKCDFDLVQETSFISLHSLAGEY